MSAETAAPSDFRTDGTMGLPRLRDRLAALRDRVVLPGSQEGWMVLGGVVLALTGLLIAAASWPSIVTDEFGSVVEGSAAWSAVGIAVAAIGGLMCVAAAAAYGVLLGHERAVRDDDLG